MADRGPVHDTLSFGPWNPGLSSHIPAELKPLCTIYRPEHVFTTFAAAQELHGLTGLPPSDLVAFRPRRLVLHELLIRITADFEVPDGSRVEDLGIKFREMTTRILQVDVEPQMASLEATFQAARAELAAAVRAALSQVMEPFRAREAHDGRAGGGLLARLRRRPAAAGHRVEEGGWGLAEITECERRASRGDDGIEGLVYRTLAKVMSALFATNGRAWGTPEQIVAIATDLAGNVHGGDAVGRALEPLIAAAAAREGYRRLPRQPRPVVINTKGPSASGKSTLRPMQKQLAGDLGLEWRDFALISPDIWRKQLLDYGSLGDAYKYAGAFTGDELQIVDQKLDRYMARKNRDQGMSHLLIDRFRFDSFAPDSSEAGSNLLTRFGHTVYLFFMVTAPELLVERAWNRGLAVGRYKAVDDTLAHAVEAYAGMPDVFFTFAGRADKRIYFEFLDNSVRLGERPRTAAFGDGGTINVLDPTRILDVERHARIDVNAKDPRGLYPRPELLAPQRNLGILKRCVSQFERVNFATQATGRVYLAIESGALAHVDVEELERAIRHPDVRASVAAVAPAALDALAAGGGRWRDPAAGGRRSLKAPNGGARTTLGVWGEEA